MNTDAPGTVATASDLVAPGDPMQPAINRLLNEPGRFGFFQAVRLLYSVNGFDGRGTGAAQQRRAHARRGSLGDVVRAAVEVTQQSA